MLACGQVSRQNFVILFDTLLVPRDSISEFVKLKDIVLHLLQDLFLSHRDRLKLLFNDERLLKRVDFYNVSLDLGAIQVLHIL